MTPADRPSIQGKRALRPSRSPILLSGPTRPRLMAMVVGTQLAAACKMAAMKIRRESMGYRA